MDDGSQRGRPHHRARCRPPERRLGAPLEAGVDPLRITALAGDGIGPEILAVAVAVLEAASAAAGEPVRVEQHSAGAAVAARIGAPVADDVVAACRSTGLVLKSPTGSPMQRRDDGTEVGMASGYLRGRLGLWANVRPARTLPAVAGRAPGPVDCVIVRENSEGAYASRGRSVRSDAAAVDVAVTTRAATARCARLACLLARARGAARGTAGRLTCVDKANVLGSHAFFRQVTAETAAQFPDVALDALYADAAAAALVERPGSFDVLVMENLLGDVLSDLAGAMVGGIGLCPSANIGDAAAMFEPIHGSAPALAGTGRANPIGQVLSAAMLLQWAGRTAAGDAIEAAVDEALAAGRLHVDTDGTLREGCAAAAAILSELAATHVTRAPRRRLLPLRRLDVTATSGEGVPAP